MPERPSRAAAIDLLNASFGIWLGIYAFRTFVPAAVWNLADALPLNLKGAIAVSVHLVGVTGCFLPFVRRPRAAVMLACVLAAIGIMRQLFLGNDAIGSALALAGWVVWLWWLPAYVRGSGRDSAGTLAAGTAIGFALQVGMQAAWHGLDLPVARGVVAVVCAVVINALFAWSAFARTRNGDGSTGGSYALVAMGAVFFLELTLFANVGTIGYLTQLGATSATWLIQAGLLGGLAVATLQRRAVAGLAVAVVIGVTYFAPGLRGPVAILLAVANAATIVLLTRSAARTPRSELWLHAAGMLILIALVFTFSSRYEWPLLWPIAALVVAGAGIRRSQVHVPGWYAAAGGLALLLTAAGLVPTMRTRGAADSSLSVLTYNIRHGYDAGGVPSIQRIADYIERTDAAVVALQEVGRGWVLLGGVDLIAYLRWRLPQYQTHYVPVNGQLWGVALMSRLPVTGWSGHVFDAPAGVFRYGYAVATIRIGEQDIRVVSVHATAGMDVDGGGTRAAQVDQMLHNIGADGSVIIAGDFNAHPDEAPIQRMQAAGYRDAGAAVGIGHLMTWPAQAPNERIDYVFLRGPLTAESGRIEPTTLSDHLPVLVHLKQP